MVIHPIFVGIGQSGPEWWLRCTTMKTQTRDHVREVNPDKSFFFYDIPASGLEWVQVYQRCESPNPPKEETQLYPTFPRYPGNKDILIFLSCNKTKIKTEPTKRGMCFGGRSTSPCTCKICKLFLLSWETVSCCTSGDRRCFVTFIFLSFFPPRKSLIGLCFCPPLMWSLYTQLKRMYTQACFEEEKN